MMGLISAATSLVGGLTQTALQNAYNKELAILQGGLNLKMDEISRRRDKRDYQYYYDNYNSPLAQMQAYKNAGLNPNLIYGQMSGLQAPQERNIAAPQMQPLQAPNLSNLGDIISAIQNDYYRAREDNRAQELNAAQVANLMANAANTTERTKSEVQRQFMNEQQKVLNNLKIDYERSTNPLRKNLLLNQINQVQENIKNMLFRQSLETQRFSLDRNKFLESIRQFNVSDEYRKNPEYHYDPNVRAIVNLLSPNGKPSGLMQSFREYWRKWTNTNQGGAERYY